MTNDDRCLRPCPVGKFHMFDGYECLLDKDHQGAHRAMNEFREVTFFATWTDGDNSVEIEKRSGGWG